MKAIVVFPAGGGPVEKAAQAVREGASLAGMEAGLAAGALPQELPGFDLVFFGSGVFGVAGGFDEGFAKAAEGLAGRKVALFCVHSGRGKAVVEGLEKRLSEKGVKVVGTLCLRSGGVLGVFGVATLSETDLARATAFGERTANGATGRRVVKESEKARIKGYRK